MSAPTYLSASLVRRATDALIRRDLREAFRRIVWIGSKPDLPENRPVVLYANHHGFHDGHLLWLLVRETLGRPFVLWMEQWDRAPMFASVGALPFPPDDKKRRFRTLRESIRRLNEDPQTVLILFPEGELRSPDSGLGPLQTDFEQLSRLLPDDVLWLPVALRSTWWGEDRPTGLIATGELATMPFGHEAENLNTLLHELHSTSPDVLENSTGRVVFEGRKSANERWNLSWLVPLFRRWT